MTIRRLYVSKFSNTYRMNRHTTLLFHGVTGAIDEVPAPLGRLLANLRNLRSPLPEHAINPATAEQLRQRGHLTPLDPENEQSRYEQYVSKLHSKRTSVSSGYLMLVPTYSCNLRCPYCFQNFLRESGDPDPLGTLSAELVDTYFTVTVPTLFRDLADGLDITLYGGEPFSAATESAVDRILSHTMTRGDNVNAITNGTQVHHFLRFFGPAEGMINGVQISLDGASRAHNKSRTPRTGEPTYDTILKNIALLSDKNVEVSIRVNVTPQSVETLDELADDLLRRDIITRSNVSAYCRAVHKTSHADDESDFPSVFSQWTLSRHMTRLKLDQMASPLSRTCGSMARVFTTQSGIALTRTNFCMQNRPFALLLDHLRDVYGCYDEAGYTNRRIGRVNDDGHVQFNDLYQKYQSRTVVSHEPCRSCSIGLTCGGGCPTLAQVENGTIFSSYCDSQKELVASSVLELHRRGFLAANSASQLPVVSEDVAPLI